MSVEHAYDQYLCAELILVNLAMRLLSVYAEHLCKDRMLQVFLERSDARMWQIDHRYTRPFIYFSGGSVSPDLYGLSLWCQVLLFKMRLMNNMFGKILCIVGLVSAGLLLLVLTATTPSTAGAFGILAVFLLGYITTLTLVTFGLWISVHLWSRVGTSMHMIRPKTPFTIRTSYYYASVIALAPVIIVSLQSVGAVGLYEIILVAFFVALGCVYVAKRIR